MNKQEYVGTIEWLSLKHEELKRLRERMQYAKEKQAELIRRAQRQLRYVEHATTEAVALSHLVSSMEWNGVAREWGQVLVALERRLKEMQS